MKFKIRHSLFFRFFWTLVALSVIPMAISAFFFVATYHARIADRVSQAVASELLENAAIQFFLIFLFVLIIATFAAYLISRNISRPLRTLTDAARRIGEGDLNIKINITRKDEIGTLGEFFNEMVGNVKEVQERQAVISQLKSEFISIAAHQLRTPLSVMKWSHHILLDGDVGEISPKQREMIEKADLANESMIKLVHNLLDAAGIEEGKFGFKFEEMEMTSFLKNLYEQKKLLAENKQVVLRLGSGVSGAWNITGDAERLSMAIGNIIDNAIRYTPSGGTVEVDMKAEPSAVIVSVKDTGIGISIEDRERLFTKFFRGSSVRHLETLGTGLGLFIAKNVISSHNGVISVESEKGHGTTFFIRLPREHSLAKVPVAKSFESFVRGI